MSNRQSGTVKWYDNSKGHGVITPKGGGDELHVHMKDIESEGFDKQLVEGQAVSFVAEKSGKDMHAKQVRPE